MLKQPMLIILIRKKLSRNKGKNRLNLLLKKLALVKKRKLKNFRLKIHN
jgi:hypothetical protein